MTTAAIRKKLHDYIADATDSKVKGMYLLLQDELDKKEEFQLTPRHLEILEEERTQHSQGRSKSFNVEEARTIIRGNSKKV